jgi:uncharacterized membrane protein
MLSVTAFILYAATPAPLSAQVTFPEFPLGALVLDMSANGSVMIGVCDDGYDTTAVFRWTASGGYEIIGSNKIPSEAHISRDRKVILANLPDSKGAKHAAIWSDGRERLLHEFGWAGEAWATNDVGSIIVGQFHPMDQNNRPIDGGASTYLYTAWDGCFEDLRAVDTVHPREKISQPYTVSGDGPVVVGESGWSTKIAMIWTRDTGMMALKLRLAPEPGVGKHCNEHHEELAGCFGSIFPF